MEVSQGFLLLSGKSASPAACAISTIPRFPEVGKFRNLITLGLNFSTSQIPNCAFFLLPTESRTSMGCKTPCAPRVRISQNPSPPSVRGTFVTLLVGNRSDKTDSAKVHISKAESEPLHLSQATRKWVMLFSEFLFQKPHPQT